MGLLLETWVWLNRRLPAAAALDRRDSEDAYSRWEYDTGRRIFSENFGADRLRGVDLLDAACGPAGKTAWYAEAGARRVLGVDLEQRHLAQGRRFATAHGVADRVHFAVADATRLPARDATFDAVTANDAMEHFSEPAAALGELARVLRPGGRLYVTFPPYWSAWGAHLYDHVRIPWCQLLMPRRVLYGVVERAADDAERAADDAERSASGAERSASGAERSASGAERSASGAERSKAGADVGARARQRAHEAIDFFETQLNRMSVSRFVALVRAEPRLLLRRLVCMPLKLHRLPALASIPVARELLTALAIAELERVA